MRDHLYGARAHAQKINPEEVNERTIALLGRVGTHRVAAVPLGTLRKGSRVNAGWGTWTRRITLWCQVSHLRARIQLHLPAPAIFNGFTLGVLLNLSFGAS